MDGCSDRKCDWAWQAREVEHLRRRQGKTDYRARLRLNDLERTRAFTIYGAYAKSKLALMMATFEWARRLAGVSMWR